MATFEHRRTGRTVEVSELRARGYRTDARWVELPPDIAVPDGTVPKVLEWAGDDPDRRAAALAAERAGKRRKGILDALGS